ncbi:hypothetical protein K469DRAFT_716887 [Zopfia rhizophila CBS 207.26]|uniref:Autophagy protein n=1 Tax=Zopfia rhizophila CBS 207.26 TaxID=1314779 RepID=A0A6A6ENS8_9PEZI|nr:hypothetical protein K469DRAFT_716887 [Zopfia rhizophila CBS 207.26]
MGWLWSSGDTTSTKDKLDPSLKEFLEKEAPSGSKPSLPSQPAPAPPKPSAPSTSISPATTAVQKAPNVPKESQFQDGRYADLWKNYTPQHVLDARGKTDQEKLKDIVDAYNDKKSEIGRVALENCAFEYMQQFECFRKPSWTQVATMCRAEQKRFNRCYDIQSKFLKALGYLTMDARSPEEDERIQMHADKLYQQMLEQERLIEKAKEEGKPIPEFESVLSRQNVARAVAGKPSPTTPSWKKVEEEEEDVWSHIKQASREEYEKKLAKLPPEDQEIERKAVEGELQAQTKMTKKLEEAFVEERINRMKRREAGQATIGDTIKSMWGWG